MTCPHSDLKESLLMTVMVTFYFRKGFLCKTLDTSSNGCKSKVLFSDYLFKDAGWSFEFIVSVQRKQCSPTLCSLLSSSFRMTNMWPNREKRVLIQPGSLISYHILRRGQITQTHLPQSESSFQFLTLPAPVGWLHNACFCHVAEMFSPILGLGETARAWLDTEVRAVRCHVSGI